VNIPIGLIDEYIRVIANHVSQTDTGKGLNFFTAKFSKHFWTKTLGLSQLEAVL